MNIFKYIYCPFHKITGLYCPGCGITRMIINITKGNFYQAFRYNPLLFILIPIAILLFINYLSKYKLINQKTQEKIYIFLIIILIIFGIIRNIPFFSYLKPTKII